MARTGYKHGANSNQGHLNHMAERPRINGFAQSNVPIPSLSRCARERTVGQGNQVSIGAICSFVFGHVGTRSAGEKAGVMFSFS